MPHSTCRFWPRVSSSGGGLRLVAGCLITAWLAVVWMGAGVGPAFAHDFRQGDVVMDHPYATPSLAGTTTGAVYFKSIRNKGKTPDRLLSARTAVAARVEIHQMQMDGNVMRMRQVPALELPAQTEVSLRHGGAGTHHLMLLDMAKPLQDGDRFDLELVFEKAGTRRVNVWVQTPRAGAPAHKH